MEYIQSHPDAGAKLSAFLMDPDGAAKLPEFTRNKLVEASGRPSPLDRYVDTVEALFGAAGEVNAKARMLGAQLGTFIAAMGWHEPSRYQAIGYTFMRRSNIAAPQGVTYQPAAEDPAPNQSLVQAAQTNPPPEPVPAP